VKGMLAISSSQNVLNILKSKATLTSSFIDRSSSSYIETKIYDRLAAIHTYELWIGIGNFLRGGSRLVSRGPLRPGESGGSSVSVRDKKRP
jgi:hypothetical protein